MPNNLRLRTNQGLAARRQRGLAFSHKRLWLEEGRAKLKDTKVGVQKEQEGNPNTSSKERN